MLCSFVKHSNRLSVRSFCYSRLSRARVIVPSSSFSSCNVVYNSDASLRVEGRSNSEGRTHLFGVSNFSRGMFRSSRRFSTTTTSPPSMSGSGITSFLEQKRLDVCGSNPHSAESIKEFINNYSEGHIEDYQMSAWLMSGKKTPRCS